MPRRRRRRSRARRGMVVSEIAIGYIPNASTLFVKRQNLYDRFSDRPFRIDRILFEAGLVNGNSAMAVVRVFHPGFAQSATTSGPVIITSRGLRRNLRVRSPEWWPADQGADTNLVVVDNICQITGGDKATIRVCLKLFIQLGQQEVTESCPKQLHAIPTASARPSLGEPVTSPSSTPLHVPPVPTPQPRLGVAGKQYKPDTEPGSSSWIALDEEDGRPCSAGSTDLQPVTMEFAAMDLETAFQGGEDVPD